AGGMHPKQDRVAVAVFRQLLDCECVAGRFALVPETVAGAAEEMRLTALARQADRLVVHPGEHQHAAAVCILDDRRGELRLHPATGPPARAVPAEAMRDGRAARARSTRATRPGQR